jgi:replicative DNA helicase
MTTTAGMHDKNAERAVVGAALVHEGLFDSAGLSPSDFFIGLHGAAWAAMGAARAKDRGLDPMTVADAMKLEGEPDALEFLIDCMGAAPVSGMVTFYVEIVRRDACRRRMQSWAAGLVERVGKEQDVEAMVAEARGALEEVASGHSGGPVRVGGKMSDVLDAVAAKAAKPHEHGVPTGIEAFDRTFGHLGPGRLVVIAARPGIGKTSLVRTFGLHAAVKRKIPVLLFSLEMTFQELAECFISAHVRIPAEALDRGSVSYGQFRKIYKEVGPLTEAPLFVDDRMLSAAQISATARAWRAEMRVPQVLVAVDYLGLIRAGERSETRALEVGRMTWAMKSLAKDLACPVILVAQLNRQIESRNADGGTGYPKLSDLRDSGEIEQHAHMVVFPHRNPPLHESGPADLVVAKNRGGRTGVIQCHWQAEYMTFGELAQERDYADDPRAGRD